MNPHRIRRAGAALLAILALARCGDDAVRPIPPGRVEGKITTVTGTAVTGAAVLLVSTALVPVAGPVVSDAAGRYVLDAAAPGSHLALLYATDSLALFARSTDRVEVHPARTTVHDVTLIDSELWHAGPVYIEGRVRDAVSAAPIHGAFVADVVTATFDLAAQYAGTTVPWFAATDAGGRFVLTATPLQLGLELGIVPITITRSGYEPRSVVGDGGDVFGLGALLPFPAVGDTLHVEVHLRPESRLQPRGAIAGTVRAGGVAVAGVRVGLSMALVADPDTLHRAAAKPPRHHLRAPVPDRFATTDAEGRFRIDGLHAGSYFVSAGFAAGDGFVPDSEPREVAGIGVADGAVTPVDVVVLHALAPAWPPRGHPIQPGMVTVSWDAFTPPPGYDALTYEVQAAPRFPLASVVQTTATQATIGPFAGGDVVRWWVTARARNMQTGLVERLAAYETVTWFAVAAAIP